MSDSISSPKPRPFEALISARIPGGGQPTPAEGATQNVFRQVSSTEPEKRQVAAEKSVDAAVSNVRESRVAVDRLSDSEPAVERNNIAAAEASIPDVAAASKLADELAKKIRDDKNSVNVHSRINRQTTEQLLS